MNKIRSLLLLLTLVGLTLSQTVTLPTPIDLNLIYTPSTISNLGPEYNDPAFIKLIDNYFGCKTWQEGFCIECSASYIFNKNGICCSIDTYCQLFNRNQGICDQCYTGY